MKVNSIEKAWEAAPGWEQDENGIYFRPDTRYTAEECDMYLEGKNLFEEVSSIM